MTTAAGAVGIVSDDFYEGAGAKSPDPGWTFDNAGDANNTQAWETPGTSDSLLVLTASEARGNLSDVDAWDTLSFVQATDATAGDFGVETRIQSFPTDHQWDEAGIVIEMSGGDRLLCGTYQDNVGAQYTYIWRTGQGFAAGPSITFPTTEIWLRLVRTGTTWTASYSLNGSWPGTTIGSYASYSATPANVGVYVGNVDSRTTDLVVKFDYFFELSAPIASEDSAPVAPNRRVMVIT